MDKVVSQQLVQSFVDFLRSQLEEKQLSEEGSESVEVALQCLETAYNLPPALPNGIDLYTAFTNAVHLGGISYQESSEEDKAEALRLKNEGNDLLRTGNFVQALELYKQAILKDPSNAVYYGNTAAAHSKMGNHELAIEECNRALVIDPNYSKAYGRMGLAFSELGNFQEACDSYKKALEMEPDNEGYKANLEIAKANLSPNPFAGLMNSGGGLAGLAGAGGGMPDIANLLSNPALMNMAQTLMTDPNMQNMMSNLLGGAGGAPGMAPPGVAPPEGAPPSSAPAPDTPATEAADAAPGAPGGPGIEGLLQAGRQLAEQMQNQHPDLLDQLRTQFQAPPPPQP